MSKDHKFPFCVMHSVKVTCVRQVFHAAGRVSNLVREFGELLRDWYSTDRHGWALTGSVSIIFYGNLNMKWKR